MFDRHAEQPSATMRIVKVGAIGLLLFISAIAIFSLFNWQGPGDYLRYGEIALSSRRYQEAISNLDQAERMEPDLAQLKRILDLRSMAAEKVKNLKVAEKDLSRLVEVTKDKSDLAKLNIRMAGRILLAQAAQAGKKEQLMAALALATRAFGLVEALDGHGNDAIRLSAQETAGRCCQRAYQIAIKKTQAGLSVPLSREALSKANKLILQLFFKPENDRSYALVMADLRQLLTVADLSRTRIAKLEEEIAHGRDWVKKAFYYYGQALCRKKSFTAFQGISGLLSRSGRSDEAAMICQLRLLDGESPYLGRAADRLARLHIKAGRNAEARAVLETWLATNQPKQLAEKYGSFPLQAQDAVTVLLDLYVAAEMKNELAMLVDKVWPLWKQHSGRLATNFDFYTGMRNYLSKLAPKKMEERLASFADRLADKTSSSSDYLFNFYSYTQKARFKSFRNQKNYDSAHHVLREWIDNRPFAEEPLLLQANLFQEQLKEAECRISLQRAYKLNHSEKTLDILWQARDRMLDRIGKKPALIGARLRQQNKIYSSSLSHPHLHLGLARWFWQKNDLNAALYHAQAAHLYYSRSLKVSILLNSIRLQAGRLPEARSALEIMCVNHPHDQQVLELLSKVYRRLGGAKPGFNLDLVLHGRGAEGFRAVIKGLMARVRWPEALEATEFALAQYPEKSSWFNLAAGDCCRHMDQPEQAAGFYCKILADDPIFLKARERAIMSLAEKGESQRLFSLSEPFMRATCEMKQVLRLARFLDSKGRFKLALKLVENLARRPKLKDKGAVFTFLAVLHRNCGHDLQAIEAAEAALSFPGGEIALPFLVTTYMVNGNKEQAIGVLEHEKRGAFSARDQTILGILLQSETPPQFETLHGRGFLEIIESRAASLLAGRNSTDIPSTSNECLDQLVTAFPEPILTILFLLRQDGFAPRAHQLALKLMTHLENPSYRTWVHFLQGECSFKARIFYNGITEMGFALVADPTNLTAWKRLSREVEIQCQTYSLPIRVTLLQQGLFPLWQTTLVTEQGIRALIPADWSFLGVYNRMLADTIANYSAILEKGGNCNPEINKFAAYFRDTARLLKIQSFQLLNQVDITELIIENKLDLACRSISMAYFNTTGHEKEILGDSFFRLVRKVPELETVAKGFAEQINNSEKPFGPALHYLIDMADQPRALVVQQMKKELMAHLEVALKSPLKSVDFQWGGATVRALGLCDPILARDGARKLLERCPSLWPAWDALGFAYAQLGREEQAKEIYTLLATYPTSKPSLRPGAIQYMAGRNLPCLPALATCQATTGLTTALMNLRWGEYKKAAKLFADIAPSSPQTLFYGAYADIFQTPANKPGARNKLNRLIKQWPKEPLSRHAGLVLRMLEPDVRKK